MTVTLVVLLAVLLVLHLVVAIAVLRLLFAGTSAARRIADVAGDIRTFTRRKDPTPDEEA